MNEAATQEKQSSESTANLIYILYLAGIFVGITGIVGVVMAYTNIKDAPEWLKTHYQFQIRTFWIGALYLLIGVLLTPIAIGYFIFLFWVLWLLVRCIKGMKSLEDREAHQYPKGWMF